MPLETFWERACSEIANWFNRGTWGLPQNIAEAKFYYKKMRECDVKDSLPECRERMNSFLDNPQEDLASDLAEM